MVSLLVNDFEHTCGFLSLSLSEFVLGDAAGIGDTVADALTMRTINQTIKTAKHQVIIHFSCIQMSFVVNVCRLVLGERSG